MNKTLLIIDPQNDFCDIPEALTMGNKPTLPVPGSHNDMIVLSDYIKNHSDNFNEIIVTLDSHNIIDIAHKLWWVDKDGNHPSPFTVITLKDIENGVWVPSKLNDLEYAKFYVYELEKASKYSFIIWPEHCLIGSWGHNVHSVLAQSLSEWTAKTGKNVEYVLKGLNPLTEHYSAIKAEVELDEHTNRNIKLLNKLAFSDELLVAGEAFSHCVSSTVFDIKDYFEENDVKTKITIFENCTSPVYGFEEASKNIKEKMITKGLNFVNV